MYYRLKYGIGGMDKVITKGQYEALSFGDQIHYEMIYSRNCGSDKLTLDKIKEQIDSAYERAYAEYDQYKTDSLKKSSEHWD